MLSEMVHQAREQAADLAQKKAAAGWGWMFGEVLLASLNALGSGDLRCKTGAVISSCCTSSERDVGVPNERPGPGELHALLPILQLLPLPSDFLS